ncbi:5-methylcytosine rRNA methyltransferase nsun-4-like [Uloborus diversus]|uniref:5-methylcytosine rRNA methyltransferase nsun-4-like n=1 Tax=Uloborus diversus TaxID=327109 RepID=UPI00240A1C3A|nr:5-methylcytosine rRNA methyltransferase nsun-4-like [Uloborus diversus]
MMSFYSCLKASCFKFQKFNSNFIRFYSTPKAKKSPISFALDHFDQFYGSFFPNWTSIRLGLLCPHSYCAVVNSFAKNVQPSELFGDMDVYNLKDAYHLGLAESTLEPTENNAENVNESNTTKTDPREAKKEAMENQESDFHFDHFNNEFSTVLENEDKEYMPATKFRNRDLDFEEDYTGFYQPNMNYKAQLVKHGAIHYPEHWNIYYCPRGKFKKFPQPLLDSTNLLNYYLMDGASVLPVLALDVQKDEEVGDLCASPGGKSLAILFGLKFGKLVCNDASLSRVNKLKIVLNTYLPGTQEWSKKILVSNLDVVEWNCFEAFDKILLDVPCTNDRLSVTKDANNIFVQKRYHERMMIPQLQTSMLIAALKALKPGGSLVYSTCSLSPVQNDGVVHMALSNLYSESPFEFIIQDLSEAFSPLRKLFQFSDVCKYGQLVVPFLPLNYGPMYIAKIKRNK